MIEHETRCRMPQIVKPNSSHVDRPQYLSEIRVHIIHAKWRAYRGGEDKIVFSPAARSFRRCLCPLPMLSKLVGSRFAEKYSPGPRRCVRSSRYRASPWHILDLPRDRRPYPIHLRPRQAPQFGEPHACSNRQIVERPIPWSAGRHKESPHLLPVQYRRFPMSTPRYCCTMGRFPSDNCQ